MLKTCSVVSPQYTNKLLKFVCLPLQVVKCTISPNFALSCTDLNDIEQPIGSIII